MFSKRLFPIILAHGIIRQDYLLDTFLRRINLPFFEVGLAFDRFHYFSGIATHLKKNGFTVFQSSVSLAADVDRRASDLKEEILKIIDKTDSMKVHIIAHSMGGLDARHMIVNEGMADKIATLTTIGTPHHGTIVADRAIEQGVERWMNRLKYVLNLEGIRSVTTSACKEFNDFAKNHEVNNDVIYRTYSSYQLIDEIFPPFKPASIYLNKFEGKNDGLISVKSQAWDKELVDDKGVTKQINQTKLLFRADHLDQIGWPDFRLLQKNSFWNLKVYNEKKLLESKIRNVYLKMAEEVDQIFVAHLK